MTKSSYIDHAIEFSLAEGNSVKEISDGWSNMDQVIYFSKKMSQELQLKIKREEPKLRYFSTDRTPHNKAGEGFICDEYKIAISYPK
ncbi:hypothetical protein PZA22_16265 [Pectobacterium polaris]|uniref:hypothetical protein n=1 Tax=Pectobacterium polaris TaxID=2042057 RepID=UPI000E760C50|nr:hypothetical protein [Pectobacterium polaris]MDE8756041.1 hypothetical protein [Pectobacterium polaris]RJL22856.1 hypothetical protein D5074_11385 [Pectobacterium polaris]